MSTETQPVADDDSQWTPPASPRPVVVGDGRHDNESRQVLPARSVDPRLAGVRRRLLDGRYADPEIWRATARRMLGLDAGDHGEAV